MVKIIGFQVNGRNGLAISDSTSLRVSLYADGPAEEMRLCLRRGDAVLWESGIMPWRPHFELEQLPLKPCGNYRLMAEVRGAEGTARAEITLRTGMMGKPWLARWIEPKQETPIKERPIQFFEQFVPMPDHLGGHERLKPVQELSRVFHLDSIPEQATLCATAHGVYALWLNGKRVDSRRLAPETTCYESLLYYQVYDLTELLQEGENTLRVLLGDGWWIGRVGITGDSCQYGDRLAFLAQMELDYGNGRTEVIGTDEQFLSRESHIRYADLFMGEKWDMTAQSTARTPCRVVDSVNETLAVQPMNPVSVWTVLEPIAMLTTPNGELVADFGQCLAGVAELRVNCPAGTELTIDHSETLDTEGNFFRNILGRNKDQQDTLICGEGESYFCPEFTYHGFRYVRIRGAKSEEISSIRAMVIGTELQETGSFTCSDERINQLQYNIRWSTRSNMLSVPTDCPQREKAGWTGDILPFAPTGCFNYDLYGFLSAWLAQMRLSQLEDGGIPVVVPSYPAQTAIQRDTFGGDTSAAWSDACVLVPLALYRNYGDTKVLRDNLPMMEKWLEYIERNSHDYLWTDGFHFGDWIIPSWQDDVMGGAAVTGKVIAGCQYAVTVEAYIQVLEALDEPAEKIEVCRDLLEKIRTAVANAYIHEDGTIDGDLQGMYVMALRSGAARGELARKVAAHLVKRIEENDGCLDTGFVATPHLLDMLMKHGYEDVAWKLFFQTKSPSWLYQIEKGATSVWENWNAIRPDGTVTASSYNHYALGAVGSWFYRHIGGLHPTAPGWSAIEFAPRIDCGLEWASCSHHTPFGLAACKWEKTEEKTSVEVTVPYGVRASLCLPGLERELTAGVHVFAL